MLSTAPEKHVRLAQGFLFFGWCMLIGSLLWDPLTPGLTAPDAMASPFHISSPGVQVRNELISNEPYAMGARILWTMTIPLVPMFLMLFGHEAWRRLCPLSFASQIPRRLGFARKRKIVQRSTGATQRIVPLIAKGSWLHRNAWYVQTFLLYVGLNARLLFVNSDRTALAIFFSVIILAAISVGYWWGGKTWCNYFCPVNVVQKIYTEPRGILESAPHKDRPKIPQSMCRTLSRDKKNEVSTCVGCLAECGDIDLERSYWDGILEPARRNVYYIFIGLIIGFYGYYFLYAGSWDYYFSGIWTHEANALGKLLGPGFYINGVIISIPKIIAAPLTLALTGATTLATGKLLENGYRKFRLIQKSSVAEKEIVHHCLAFSAYASINTFYLFGGRPNILLMPLPVQHLLDFLIVALSTWWFWQVIQRSDRQYRREGLAASLLTQLKALKINIRDWLDVNSIDELKPDEIYVAAKILPNFSQEQKLKVYDRILSDAILNGKCSSATFLEMLEEIRLQLDVSETEHAHILEKLGIATAQDFDAQAARIKEKGAAINNYAEIMGAAVAEQIEAGKTMDAILSDRQVINTGNALRRGFMITEAESETVLSNLASPNGLLVLRICDYTEQLRHLATAKFAVQLLRIRSERFADISALLIHIINERIHVLAAKMLNILRILGGTPEALWSAHNIGALLGTDVGPILLLPVSRGTNVTFQESLDEVILSVLDHDEHVERLPPIPPGMKACSYYDVVAGGTDAPATLATLTEDQDEVMVALALAALADASLQDAVELTPKIRDRWTGSSHWLLEEVLDDVLSLGNGVKTSSAPEMSSNGAYSIQRHNSVRRMAWLFANPMLCKLPFSALVHAARTSEVRIFSAGAWLREPNDDRWLDEIHVIRAGKVIIHSMGDKTAPIQSLDPTDLVHCSMGDDLLMGACAGENGATVVTIKYGSMLVRHVNLLPRAEQSIFLPSIAEIGSVA